MPRLQQFIGNAKIKIRKKEGQQFLQKAKNYVDKINY